jgi:nicotinamidase-related amidase
MASLLLIIDMQVGVLKSCDRAEQAVTNTALLLARARAAGAPVVFVQHESDNLIRGSLLWQLPDELAPLDSEPRVFKRYRDGFAATDLKEVLEAAFAEIPESSTVDKHKQLVIVGAESNNCVWTTTTRALVEGYDVALVSDAHTTSGIELPSGPVSGAQLSDAVNDYFTGKTADGCYPGRLVSVPATAEVVF